MSSPTGSSIIAREAEHFGGLAADWWNPKGSSAMLHKLNPVRLGYIREAIDRHWGGDGRSRTPLAGKRALDVGCGAGLLCEPLARMGAEVSGVDAAPENIAAAKEHAAGQGLDIDYRHGDITRMKLAPYDLVTSLEVIEHVADPAAFVTALAEKLDHGGLMILSTPNRTALSRFAMITVGEGLGQIPKGTHDWSQFLNPEELEAHANAAGLQVTDKRGLSFSPTRGFQISDDMTLNYLMTLVKG